MKIDMAEDVISTVGRILSEDPDLKYTFMDLNEEGFLAAYCDKTNEIIMPKLNVLSLTDKQIRTLSAFSAHERKHKDLSNPQVRNDFLANANELEEHLYRVLEDARIERNKYSRSPGSDYDIQEFRKDEFRETVNSSLAYENPFGYLSFVLQYEFCEYGNATVHDKLYI